MSQYTSEQLAALAKDRHLSVNANAGSGKTYILVERYLSLIEPNESGRKSFDPSQILAITFTKKAAAEMRSRVIKRLNEKISEAEQNSARDRLRELNIKRDKMNSAKITTIHSFCKSLLSDYPVEADLNPNFRELGFSEGRLAIDSSINYALEEFLDRETPDFDLTKKLLLEVGRKTVIEILQKMLRDPYAAAETAKNYGRDSEEALRDLNNIIILQVRKDIRDLLNDIDKFFDTADISLLKAGSAANKNLIQLKKAHDKFLSYLDNEGTMQEVIVCTLRFLRNYLRKSILTGNGIRKNISVLLEDKSVLDIVLSIEAKAKGIEKYEPEGFQPDLIALLHDYGRVISKIYSRAYELFEDEKRDLNAISFDDMMAKAIRVLENDDARCDIMRTYRYVMVDEFQDTNELQYGIIKLLISDLNSLNNRNIETSKLFIVGDVKQSIYGFRAADVRTFLGATRDIIKINTENIEAQKHKRAINIMNRTISNEPLVVGDVKLSSTFRLQPVLSAYFNYFFSRHMLKEEGNEYDVDYEEFVCGRNIDSLADFEKNSVLLDDSKGSVRFLFGVNAYDSKSSSRAASGDDEEDENDPSKISEADLLAWKVKQIVETQSILPLDENNEPREVKYSDIAIIMRRSTKFPVLAQKFQLAGVPYVLYSGKGFFETVEVKEMAAFLKFLYNKRDNLSLLATLKSAFFGIDDTELYQISTEGKASFWEKVIAHSESGNASENLKRARSIIASLISQAGKVAFDSLIAQILEITGWYGAVAKSRFAEQSSSNMKKLIAFARNFQAAGYRDLGDFVRELELHEEQSDQAEAHIDTGENVVKIMTIHASKGLEFPIVILGDINFKKNHSDTFTMDDKYGINFKLTVERNNGTYSEKISPAQYSFAKKYKDDIETAENKRLLYVAMTRAKDHLIISSQLKLNKDGSIGKPQSFLSDIFDVMQSDYPAFPNKSGVETHTLNTQLKCFDGTHKIEYKLKYPISVEAVSSISQSLAKHEPDIELDAHSKAPLIIPEIPEPGTSGEVTFSATRIMSYYKSKEEYYKKYLLGLPDNWDFQRWKYVNYRDKSSSLGTLTGTVVHYLMEKINDWVDLSGNVDEPVLKSIAEEFISSKEFAAQKNLCEVAMEEAMHSVGSPLIQSNIKQVLDSRKELSLHLPVGIDFLEGTIDLLYENDGSYEIWDWKTNNVRDKEAMIFTAQGYEFQMKFYAYLLSKMGLGINEFRCRLLFTKLGGKLAEDDTWTYLYSFSQEDMDEFIERITSDFPDMKVF